MSEALKRVQRELQQWRDTAVADGWLGEGAGGGIDAALAEDPQQLFAGLQQRPLVVALFGGTGVGKSSLLNRLAGEAVARVGVVRPTSREVTVYAHQSLSLAQLPAQIPADKVQLSGHGDDSARHLVWIDTPDVDSVATEHREQVLAWLPYVDLVIYVVSPERYRDDAGWALLREAGERHAWMFVMNQWDRGQATQLDDFRAVLGAAGFADPQVFCTVCREPAVADDFDALRAAVARLGEAGNVAALLARAEAAQAQRLREGVADCVQSMGGEARLDDLAAALGPDFHALGDKLERELAWQIGAVAQRYEHEQLGWRALLSGRRPSPAVDPGSPPEAWDERAGELLRERVAALSLAAAERGLPAAPLRARLQALAAGGAERVAAAQRERVGQALAKPGTALQRGLYRAAAAIAALAPVAALAWIGYRVVVSFYLGNSPEGEYLGVDFAVNSALLLGVAWLLPALLREKLRPSLQAAVARALGDGLREALGQLGEAAAASLTAFDAERLAAVEAAREPLARLPADAGAGDDGVAALHRSV